AGETHLPTLCLPALQPSSSLCFPSLWWLGIVTAKRGGNTAGANPAGPGATDTQGNRQQQRETADAEHQCWLPVSENPHPTHGRGEAQQGGHPPANGRVHLLPGAGEDSATAAEHPAQAVHPGVQRLLPEAATGREGRGSAAGDDRAPAAVLAVCRLCRGCAGAPQGHQCCCGVTGCLLWPPPPYAWPWAPWLCLYPPHGGGRPMAVDRGVLCREQAGLPTDVRALSAGRFAPWRPTCTPRS
uniref:Transcription factor AP-4 n=1 Tax=Bubo bubo TaxID=30461 RepID=A0A8C0FCT5_BUBBB